MRGLCRLGLVTLLAVAFNFFPLMAASGEPPTCLAQAAEPLWMSSGAKGADGDGGVSAQSFCSAFCAGGTMVQTSCSGSCTATDINCPYTQGYVTCNGVATYCQPACCSGCSYCEDVNGTSCSPHGFKRSCTGSDLESYTCTCFGSNWVCPI